MHIQLVKSSMSLLPHRTHMSERFWRSKATMRAKAR